MAKIKYEEIDTDASKMKVAELRVAYNELATKYNKIINGCYCHCCGEFKPKTGFYMDKKTTASGSKLIPTCKACLYKIATNLNEVTKEIDITPESIMTACKKADLPYVYSLYEDSKKAIEDTTGEKPKTNIWASMITQLQSLPQWSGKSWEDGDVFKKDYSVVAEKQQPKEQSEEEIVNNHMGQDLYDDFLKNKKDVIRLLSYDPFEKEALSDQPFLYSQLLGLLDSSEDANDDMMRTSSAIAIARSFLQQSKVDDTIAKLMGNVDAVEQNAATIKSLSDTRGKITSVISNLAEQNCISLKHSKNAKKGENTWTGKIDRIKNLNLREGEVNGFDMMTCRGMQQVMDMSNASILKQLHLDESEWSEMVAEQRTMITDLQKDLESYKEISRILLRENIDLKDYLEEKKIVA